MKNGRGFKFINTIDDNELVKFFYNLIPHFKHYFEDELIFTILNANAIELKEYIAEI